LLATTAFVLGPFIWMVSLSLKPPNEIFQAHFQLWPNTFYAVENYTKALTAAPLARFMLNGVIVCGVIVVAQILIAAPCAYALAKLRFPGRDALFGLVLIGLLVPQQVLAIPLFVLFFEAGILNSYASLILPFIISPFAIFLLRQFFKTIPDDLVDAARIDGLSELSIVRRIMLPAATPALIAFGILSVVSHWNDLFWPLIAVRSEDLMTPALGVVYFRNAEAGSDYGPLMAGATIIVAPLVLAFLMAQRRFIEMAAFGGGAKSSDGREG